MKYYLLPVLTFLLFVSAKAADKDSTVYYNLPDSVKAIQFMVEVNVKSYDKKEYINVGIRTNEVSLSLSAYRRQKAIYFAFPADAIDLVKGYNVYSSYSADGVMSFHYDWEKNNSYKLLISQATDSAANFSLYSGYIFLPKENKWKLIGTCKIDGTWNTIQKPKIRYSGYSKDNMLSVSVNQAWVQRQNGSWKNLKEDTQPSPVVNLFGHIDSVQQHLKDIKLIEDAMASGKTDAKTIEQGVYYTMMKEGTGKQVSVNDTVTVNYRLTLLNDTTVIQQTNDKPATFPLKRLIKGWQIGVPLCKVGGKIKLVIPSDLAYSIRTRSANIPPNSILVFEIEVLDARSPQ